MKKLLFVPMLALVAATLSGCWWGPPWHDHHHRGGGYDRGGYDRGHDRGGYDRGPGRGGPGWR